MKRIKGLLALLLAVLFVSVTLVGCGGNTAATETKPETKTETTTEKTETKTEETTEGQTEGLNEQILVVSREDGSGTRTAFTEITGVMKDDVDNTLPQAQISQGTNEVITFVSTAKASIGYISLGSLNDKVKAVDIDGVKATAEDVKSGAYKIARPFNICYKDGQLSKEALDFISFIHSIEGQEVVEAKGYIKVSGEGNYFNTEKLSGKVTIEGSTSVGPVMAKIAEAYNALQPDVVIEIQENGSSAGVKAAIEGGADIGMASRELKDSELAEVKGEVIAQDGIAVIVNKENPVSNLTIDEVRQIFVGEIANWNEVGK